jgi:hypothetical protein
MYHGFATLGRQPMAKANVKLAAVRSKRANLARSSAADEDGANSKIQADLLLASSTPRPTVASTQSAKIRFEDRTNAIFGDLHFSFCAGFRPPG